MDFCLLFFFGGKRSEILIFGCGQSFMLLYCILSLYKQEMLYMHASRSKILVSEQARYLKC